jgi:hypothetical protein
MLMERSNVAIVNLFAMILALMVLIVVNKTKLSLIGYTLSVGVNKIW